MSRDSGRHSKSKFENSNTDGSLEIQSGKLIVIDQHMLGSENFLNAYGDMESSAADNVEQLCSMYGGKCFEMDNGSYNVFRDSNESILIFCSEQELDYVQSLVDEASCMSREESLGTLFIETRCVIFADLDLISDETLMKEYQELRQSRKDKKARDLLRKNGAVIRYGFDIKGDELNISHIGSHGAIAFKAAA